MRLTFFTGIVLVCISASNLFAWGTKEHVQLTRIACIRLLEDPQTPPEMKAWLKEITPGLTDMAAEKMYFMEARQGIVPRGVNGIAYWVVMPDIVALTDQNRNVAPYGAPERNLHFIDMELLHPDPTKQKYSDDLSSKPNKDAFPKDIKDARYVKAGQLPFRLEESYQKLVENIRAGKLSDKPGQFPRDEHAAKWAGYLCHYIQDNTQPHHATIDYQSRSYFGSGSGRAPGVHAEVEYRMADDENADFLELREEYWTALQKALATASDPIQTTDLFEATIEVSLSSYDALPLIGSAAKASASGETIDTVKFFHFRGPCFGKDMSVLEMKAQQQAWAIVRTQRILRQAWDDAKK